MTLSDLAARRAKVADEFGREVGAEWDSVEPTKRILLQAQRDLVEALKAEVALLPINSSAERLHGKL